MDALQVSNDPPASEQTYTGAEWYPDIAASAHVTNSQQSRQTAQLYQGNDSVTVVDGNFLPITHIGYVPLQSTSGTSDILSLKDVLVCPNKAK